MPEPGKPATYVKRPIHVEAICYDGDNTDEAVEFGMSAVRYIERLDRLVVDALEGEITVAKGDWLIRGPYGEFHTCRPEIFENVYSLVETEIEPAEAF